MKYTEEIAKNTKDHQILTDILREEENDYVSWYAAQNPNCTPEILTEVLRRGNDDGVSCSAAENPNCPKEMLVEVLRRGKDDTVSWYAAKNPNCPPEARINWMYLTYKIAKEDPTKHIIEYEKIKEDNFQDLKDLL